MSADSPSHDSHPNRKQFYPTLLLLLLLLMSLRWLPMRSLPSKPPMHGLAAPPYHSSVISSYPILFLPMIFITIH